MAPFCFCQKNPCFCRLKWVIYLLKCCRCGESYVGKTERQLRLRLMEHRRGIVKGTGSALAKHQCTKEENCYWKFDVLVLARAKGRKAALSLMEAKMILKYKPTINIRKEQIACEKAKRMGKALREKDSCKEFEKSFFEHYDDEDESGDVYCIEESEEYCNGVETEPSTGQGAKVQTSNTEKEEEMEAEKLWNELSNGDQRRFALDPDNYHSLVERCVHNHSDPFDIHEPYKRPSETNTSYQSPPVHIPSGNSRPAPVIVAAHSFRKSSPSPKNFEKKLFNNNPKIEVSGKFVGAATGAVVGAAFGAVAGAKAGAVAGPPVALVCAVVGAAIGAEVGAKADADAGPPVALFCADVGDTVGFVAEKHVPLDISVSGPNAYVGKTENKDHVNVKAGYDVMKVQTSLGGKQFVGAEVAPSVNAGINAGAGSYGVNAGANVAQVRLGSANSTSVSANLGLRADTGVSIRNDSIGGQVLGTGIQIGRETKISFLGSSIGFKLW